MSSPPASTFVALLLVAGCLTIWTGVIRRLRHGRPVVAFAARRPVPWNAGEVFVAISLWFLARMLFVQAVYLWRNGSDRGGDEPVEHFDPGEPDWTLIASDALASVVGVVLVAVALWLVARATWRDLGFNRAWRHDAKLGLLAFVAIAPPVYAVQWLLTQWIPSEHPISNIVEQHPLVAMLSAVVVAPLAEEFIFRVVLQGWLEKRFQVGTDLREHTVVRSADNVDVVPTEEASASSMPETSTPADSSQYDASAIAPDSTARPGIEMAIPILISSGCFAAIHATHGPDPIPLFLFALVLGYLYQRTHSIWPSVVTHASLNLSSLAVLWLEG